MTPILLNWIVLFIIFGMYLLNLWRSNVIKKINIQLINLKKEKEELIEKSKHHKELYQEIIKNYSALIQENK